MTECLVLRGLAVAALLALGATRAEAAGTAAAEIRLFTFRPAILTVAPGTTVTWTNRDAVEHSVTHGTPEAPGEAFDSGFFTRGGAFSFTFGKAGEYPYFCARHTSMRGVVRVGPAP